MKVTILGTGTSSGVPQLLCGCEVCRSTDPRDRRSRSSALVTTSAGNNILIDCGPDLLAQFFRIGAPERLDAVLITHSHYDHIAGIDELRPYCMQFPKGLPIYCTADVADDLRVRMPYCFHDEPRPRLPHLDLRIIDPDQDGFTIEGEPLKASAIPVMHGRLPIVGYRIGPFAYVTDCKSVLPGAIDRLKGVDTLVINALRHTPHPTHMNLKQAIDVITEVAPRRAFLTHMSHGIGLHAITSRLIPKEVEIAYDGMTLHVTER